MRLKTKPFLLNFLVTGVLAGMLVLCLHVAAVHASTFGGVQGKVTDAAGKPLAGVKVTLVGGGGTATTDKSGSYDIEGITPGDYDMEASRKGYQKTSVKVTIIQDVPAEVDLTLTPS